MQSLNIIGCGPSAALWNGQGESLGVNDCWKYGHPTDYLLVVDFPNKFAPKRLNVIHRAAPKKFFTQLPVWMQYAENIELIHLTKWRGRLEKGKINSSLTTPFIALSIAWNLGYKEIVLWGVDMNPDFERSWIAEEITNIRELVNLLELEGIKVWLGSKGSALTFLPVKNGSQ